MQDPASGVPRTYTLRSSVNRGGSLQRSLLALMVLLTMLYGCAESSKPVERVDKQHGYDQQARELQTTAAALAPEPPASEPPASEPSNLPDYKEMIEKACEDWDSKVRGTPPAFCYPAGLGPAFCHSASSPAFCQ